MLENPRWVVADQVAEAVRQRYRADVLAIGVHGSLAHGDDTENSDVGLVVVTYSAGTGPRPSGRRIDGVLVDLGVVGSDEYLRHARTLSMSWPLAADRYVTTKPIFDPDGWFERLRDTHLARLAEAGAREFSALAREAWCRASSAHGKAIRLASWHETEAALAALAEARVAAALVSGLLTRTYFRHSADAVRRTGLAGADITEVATVLRGQAEQLATRGRPVDGTITDLLA
ncbi:MAG TPA: nucleotidyltransferase domain-containing protein [Micromonosporaceae bacterium]|nr:nucleotidyltransferase domain-containing protein [Micromonosporaceae bacterium]